MTRRAFETALTHALARAHGVVGGAIHVHHIAFRAANASDPTLPGETNAAAGVGTFRVHRDHAAKVATAVTMLAETHDGSPCVARTCAAASSPHAVAFDARAARRARLEISDEGETRGIEAVTEAPERIDRGGGRGCGLA